MCRPRTCCGLKTWLAARQSRVERSSGGGITSDPKLLGDNVTAGESQTEDGEKAWRGRVPRCKDFVGRRQVHVGCV